MLQFFLKASEWFNKVPFSDADKATGIGEVIAQFGITQGQKFDYDALSDEQKKALDVAVIGVQAEFAKIAADPPVVVVAYCVVPGSSISSVGLTVES